MNSIICLIEENENTDMNQVYELRRGHFLFFEIVALR